MIQSYTGARALFIGNGINRTEKNNGTSWIELLGKISAAYGIEIDLTNDLKPLPMVFEELLNIKQGGNSIDNKLKRLKTTISKILTDEASQLIDNGIHKEFMQCGIKEIITTNYDYNLETAMIPNFISEKALYAINNREPKHSLYRRYNIDGVNVRHIHGELSHNIKITPSDVAYPEQTIMVGFKHYSDYLGKIQKAIRGQKGRHSDEEKKSLFVRIKDNKIGKSWIDLLFTHQVIFAGFSFDFSENHLWWLLLYRDELKRKSNKFNISINNEISFYYPEIRATDYSYLVNNEGEFLKLYKRKLDEQKSKGVADILKSLNVEVHALKCGSYKDFYLQLINIINRT